MAGMRDLHRLWACNSSLIADLQRNAGLLAALRCVSTCVLTNKPANYELLKGHRITTKRRHFSIREFSALDGDQVEGVPAFDRVIQKSKGEINEIQRSAYIIPSDARILKVSILGAPNAGKSTLTNALMGWRICSVSTKVHTTQHNTKAILMQGNTQIVFVDTPGLVTKTETKRHQLEPSMLNDPKVSVNKADLVLVLVDASNKFTRHKLGFKVQALLKGCVDKKVALVLNKVDLVKSKELLLRIIRELTEGNVDGEATHIVKRQPKPKALESIFSQTEKILKDRDLEGDSTTGEASQQEPETATENDPKKEQSSGWPYFSRIFMISALQEDGIKELKDYLFCEAKPGKWMYNPSFVTDQKPEEIAILAVREKFLDYLPKEIPYNLDLKVEFWEVDPHGVLRIAIIVKCPMKHQVKLVIGPRGDMVSKVSNEARQLLMNTFRCEVSLKLVINSEESTGKKK